MESLNGQLITSRSESLVHLASKAVNDSMPREIVLELTPRRAAKPVFSPSTHLTINRPDLTPDQGEKLFDQFAKTDDIRLTLAGVGDPLLNPDIFEIIKLAQQAGIRAIHLETDLVEVDPARLSDSQVDIVSVHIPAVSPEIYRAIMGIDALSRVLENIRRFIIHRQSRSSGVPILVPTFIKCQQNLAEMETWYDQWLRALSTAIIQGPTDFASQIPSCVVADMSPPTRNPCARLSSRMTILSDGQIVACEQDILAKHPLGNISTDSIADIWQKKMNQLRQSHNNQRYSDHSLCGACRDWHRP
jgi:spiro-SPASM protein